MERHANGIMSNGFVEGMSAADVQQLVDQSMAQVMSQIVLTQAVVEGQTVTLPTTNQDITLNLQTGGQTLLSVIVNLPGNTDGRVGQRIFVNSDGQIAQASFRSAIQVNNSDYMFNPGDNCAFYRNQPAVISRITS